MSREEQENLKENISKIFKKENVVDVKITSDYEKGTTSILSSGMYLSSKILRQLADAFEKRQVYAKRSGTKFGLYIS